MSHSCHVIPHTGCSLREDWTGSGAHQPGEAVRVGLMGASGAADRAAHAALYSPLLRAQVSAHVDR